MEKLNLLMKILILFFFTSPFVHCKLSTGLAKDVANHWLNSWFHEFVPRKAIPICFDLIETVTKYLHGFPDESHRQCSLEWICHSSSTGNELQENGFI